MARILIVDDEPAIRLLLESLLAGAGHSTVLCRDAEAGLAEMERQSFDLIVSDKNLPGLSGLDLLQRVRERWPRVPVLLITGYASMESSLKAQALGAAGFLVKPFADIRIVEDEVARALRRPSVPPAADVEKDLARATERLAGLRRKRE